MNAKNLIPKAKNLIPYVVYLLGLIALLVTVQEPKQTLKASPSLSKVAVHSPSADRAN
jgi:hypothetical protein